MALPFQDEELQDQFDAALDELARKQRSQRSSFDAFESALGNLSAAPQRNAALPIGEALNALGVRSEPVDFKKPLLRPSEESFLGELEKGYGAERGGVLGAAARGQEGNPAPLRA